MLFVHPSQVQELFVKPQALAPAEPVSGHPGRYGTELKTRVSAAKTKKNCQTLLQLPEPDHCLRIMGITGSPGSPAVPTPPYPLFQFKKFQQTPTAHYSSPKVARMASSNPS